LMSIYKVNGKYVWCFERNIYTSWRRTLAWIFDPCEYFKREWKPNNTNQFD
jgi:hypothetical protein